MAKILTADEQASQDAKAPRVEAARKAREKVCKELNIDNSDDPYLGLSDERWTEVREAIRAAQSKAVAPFLEDAANA